MGRPVLINTRVGGGSSTEIMFGEATLEPTMMHPRGSATVFPAPTVVGIANGVAFFDDVDTTATGPTPEWVYRLRVRDARTGAGWTRFVGVPAGGTVLNFNDMPVYNEVPASERPALVDLVSVAESAAEDARVAREDADQAAQSAASAAALVGAPAGDAIRAVVNSDVGTLASDLRVNLDSTYAALPPVNATDRWFAKYGNRIVLPTHQPISTDGQVVHPSVIRVQGGWGGYKYWMAYTPYESGNDAYEDPCVVASNDGTHWELPAGIPFPLDDGPGGAKYNSDTNLAIANGVLYCFWRYLDTTATGAEEMLYFRSSTDGVNWTPKQLAHVSAIGTLRILAPSFEYFNGKWHLWGVDLNQANRPLVYRTADELGGAWSTPVNCNIPVEDNYSPWHVTVKRVGDQFVGLMNDTMLGGNGGRSANLYVISSADGIDWDRSTKPVIPRIGPEHNDMYAATFDVTPDGIDIWYSAIARNPSAWHIFRAKATRQGLGTPYAATSGYGEVDTVAANGGKSQLVIDFPAGLFSGNPIVTATSANGRCTIGLEATPTKDQAIINVFNWTTGGATTPRVFWQAIQQNA
ncbi:hypothetical protein ACTXIU_13375 [Glutamicibacter arilaitensis]|uniref:hypothetical protein n=1 Tax=Glutamicibacter arilaitensis TaxID=256701 RepID=UPI003F912760